MEETHTIKKHEFVMEKETMFKMLISFSFEKTLRLKEMKKGKNA